MSIKAHKVAPGRCPLLRAHPAGSCARGWVRIGIQCWRAEAWWRLAPCNGHHVFASSCVHCDGECMRCAATYAQLQTVAAEWSGSCQRCACDTFQWARLLCLVDSCLNSGRSLEGLASPGTTTGTANVLAQSPPPHRWQLLPFSLLRAVTACRVPHCISTLCARRDLGCCASKHSYGHT